MSSKEKTWKEISIAGVPPKIQHWIHDWRLENLHASTRPRKMHHMLNMRDVLS